MFTMAKTLPTTLYDLTALCAKPVYVLSDYLTYSSDRNTRVSKELYSVHITLLYKHSPRPNMVVVITDVLPMKKKIKMR